MKEPEECAGEEVDTPAREAHPGGIGCGARPIAVGTAQLPSGGLMGNGAPVSPNAEEPLPWNAVR